MYGGGADTADTGKKWGNIWANDETCLFLGLYWIVGLGFLFEWDSEDSGEFDGDFKGICSQMVI